MSKNTFYLRNQQHVFAGLSYVYYITSQQHVQESDQIAAHQSIRRRIQLKLIADCEFELGNRLDKKERNSNLEINIHRPTHLHPLHIYTPLHIGLQSTFEKQHYICIRIESN